MGMGRPLTDVPLKRGHSPLEGLTCTCVGAGKSVPQALAKRASCCCKISCSGKPRPLICSLVTHAPACSERSDQGCLDAVLLVWFRHMCGHRSNAGGQTLARHMCLYWYVSLCFMLVTRPGAISIQAVSAVVGAANDWLWCWSHAVQGVTPYLNIAAAETCIISL